LSQERNSKPPVRRLPASRTFRILGVSVRLHSTFVLLLIFIMAIGVGSSKSPLSYGLLVLALLASVLLHEFAHAFVSAYCGVKTQEIVMFPIGGISRLEPSAKPRQEFWIALAGPAMNLLIGGVLLWFLISRKETGGLFSFSEPTPANLVQAIALGNLILAAFNFLPAFPMDGGRMLRALLTRFRPEEEATRIAALCGRMLAISMGLYGLLTMHVVLVFVAFFVYLGAAQEGAAAMGRYLTHGVPVRAAMLTEFHTLAPGNSIRDAANLLLSTSQQDFPVIHGGQVIGLLGRNALLRAMATEGPEAYVAGVMDRDYPIMQPDTDLAKILPLMAQTGSCALVMEGERLLGLLTAENLSQFLLLRRFGMEPDAIRAPELAG